MQSLLALDKSETQNVVPTQGSIEQEQADSHGAKAIRKAPYSIEGALFLRGLISQDSRRAQIRPLNAFDAARFRLLAGISGFKANDEQVLGVHDANIVYNGRDSASPGGDEIGGLITSGLFYIVSKTSPLWYWTKLCGGLENYLLPHLSLNGTLSLQVGALTAMNFISEMLPDNVQRSTYLAKWFSKVTPDELKLAALSYLGNYGREDDLPAIKSEFDRGYYKTTYAAVDAILRINLRISRGRAIHALIELQPDSIKLPLLQAVFEKGASIDRSILTECLSHRSSDVRRIAASLLEERGAIEMPT